jgi:hypothetical protein
MTHEIWFILFVLSIVVGGVWSISREIHIYSLSSSARRLAENQLETNRVLSKVCERIESSDSKTKESFRDIQTLILDVERRQQMAAILGKHSQEINIGKGNTQIGDHNEQR